MKLKNKKTGEIVDDAQYRNYSLSNGIGFRMNGKDWEYHSLAELNEEWEDAPEEPKKYWFIDAFGNIVQNEITKHYGDEYTDMTDAYESQKQIGNYFETEEEAEKAVKKLKAWKRLKKRHFKFDDYDILNQTATWLVSREYDQYENDIKLLFGR